MDETAGVEGAGQTRRDVIKKAGVAAGVVWTAPIVMSSFSAAAAASGPSCEDSTCGSAPVCGTGGNPVDGNCYCFSTADQGPGCFENYFCNSAPGCNSSADCPPGSLCAVNTCCSPPQGFAGECVSTCSGQAPGKSIDAGASRAANGAGV